MANTLAGLLGMFGPEARAGALKAGLNVERPVGAARGIGSVEGAPAVMVAELAAAIGLGSDAESCMVPHGVQKDDLCCHPPKGTRARKCRVPLGRDACPT